jgi:hypothetical protein
MKEHLMSLSMDQKLVQEFDSLDSQVKGAFTREYNKRTAVNLAGKVKGTAGKKAKAAAAEEEEAKKEEGAETDESLSSSSDDEDD